MIILRVKLIHALHVTPFQEYGVPNSLVALKDTLMRRLRQLQLTNEDWERQIRAVWNKLEYHTS